MIWGKTCPYPPEVIVYCMAEALTQENMGEQKVRAACSAVIPNIAPRVMVSHPAACDAPRIGVQ